MSIVRKAGVYGFEYGPVRVVRLHGDEEHGVWLQLNTEREEMDVRVTKGGRLRVGEVRKRERGGHRLDIDPPPERRAS